MSGHHNARRCTAPVDMLEVWTESCARLREMKTGEDCRSCPHREACEKAADKRINRLYSGRRKTPIVDVA